MTMPLGPSHYPAPPRRKQRGFTLLIVAALFTVMIGMLGLSFDLGRMFIMKNELQIFCDSAALGGVRSLDGSRTGVQIGHSIALNGPLGSSKPNALNFDTVRITNVTDTYANTFTGSYMDYNTASGPATNSLRFLRVTATANAPLYFLGVVNGNPTGVQITATATAGQAERPGHFDHGGLIPFSPAAHDPNDGKNFGLEPGQSYTLKWGKQGTDPATACAGDVGWARPGFFPAQRGYVDLGQGDGTNQLTQAIEFGGYPNANSNPNHVEPGDTLFGVPGNKGNPSGGSLANRSAQDPEQTALTWEDYKASLHAGTANGRRVITALIDDPWQSTDTGGNYTVEVIGFGNFLLYPAEYYTSGFPGGFGSFCAIYIGPGSLTAWGSGGSNGNMVYQIMLFR